MSGRALGAVVNDIQKKLVSVHLDRGYHVELLGEYKERQAAQGRLLRSSLLAGVVILFLLQAALRRWRLAALVFLTLPMALVGGVLAAWAGGGIISLGSLVGFFTVFGIAARNGILLINHWQHLEEHEGMAFGPALVLRGARERLSPILMTSLATGLALVPLVVLGNRPGHEIELPLAVGVLGGAGKTRRGPGCLLGGGARGNRGRSGGPGSARGMRGAPAPAPAPAEQAKGEVTQAVFTTAGKDHAPVDDVTKVPGTDSRIYFFTDLRGMEGQHVVHRWEYNGKVMAEVGFDVKGARWRVWSSKNLMPAWAGKWTVSVVNGKGDVVASRDFTYGGQ